MPDGARPRFAHLAPETSGGRLVSHLPKISQRFGRSILTDSPREIRGCGPDSFSLS